MPGAGHAGGRRARASHRVRPVRQAPGRPVRAVRRGVLQRQVDGQPGVLRQAPPQGQPEDAHQGAVHLCGAAARAGGGT
ncbi:unnamed protein product, partial [Heterosigma akashiwo]